MERNGREHIDRQEGIPALHWSGRPFGVLLASAAASLLLNLLQAGVSLSLSLRETGGEWDQAFFYGAFAAMTAISLLFAVIYYRWIRWIQNLHHCSYPIAWKPGAAFWAGVALVLGFEITAYFSNAQSEPVSAILTLVSSLVSGLTSAIFLLLAFPLLEKRFGSIKGALLLCAAFALVSVLQRLGIRIIDASTLPVREEGSLPAGLWSGLAVALSETAVQSAAYCLVCAAAWLASSRRMLGAWPLALAVYGWLQLLGRAISNALLRSDTSTDGITSIFTGILVNLATAALCLCALAAFSRWKNLGALRTGLAGLARKTKTTQATDEPER